MADSYDTGVLDSPSFKQKIESELPKDDIVAIGEFVEPAEYRYIRSPGGANLVCIDSTIGFEAEVFEDMSTAFAEANYQLPRMMSFDRSAISDAALKIVENSKSEFE